ncbi:MAG TPA: (d)CMP kinase [Steroidobacteraceae bacterium]|nr:(d)CMP kinase [Steroidobacteraceae bacterium]
MSAPAAAPVIAIDGPSGSGKGTIARAVARKLGWHLLDSGALYRLTALASQQAGVDLTDGARVARVAAAMDASFDSTKSGEELIRLGGRDVTRDLRSESAGSAASVVALQPPVRAALIGRQRAFARAPGLVADGRDMGTVIFPDAGLKLFLTADAGERARRRYKQLKDKGIDASLAALFSDIAERDKRDTTRAVAPLRASEDAVVLDSTRLTIDEVVNEVLRLAQARGYF